MKKNIILPLIAVSALVGLTGCGRQLSNEDSTKLLGNIVAKVNDPTFKVPTKLTLNALIKAANVTTRSLSVISIEDNYACEKMTVETTGDYATSHMFIKDSFFYVCMDAKQAGQTSKIYQELDITNAATTIETVNGVVNTIFAGAMQMIEAALEFFDGSIIVPEDGAKAECVCFSSGDANAELKLKVTQGENSSSSKLIIEDYLPVFIETDLKSAEETMYGKMDIKWNEAKIEYPDLSTYVKQ